MIVFKSNLSGVRAWFRAATLTIAFSVLPSTPVFLVATPAYAVCAPAAASSIVAVCTGVTVDQNGLNGFGTNAETDVTLTVSPGASVNGTNFGIAIQELNSLINLGTITSGTNGIGTGTVTSLNNAGTISGGISGLGAGVITNLTNTGTITSGVTGIFSTTITDLNNHGAIRGDNEAIVAFNEITSLVNSGTIMGGLNGILAGDRIASLTNSGTIIGGTNAILVNGAAAGGPGENTLTLLAGSNIQGAINIVGSTNTLNVGNGLSIANTFETGAPVIGFTGNQPFAVSGLQVSVVDPTALGVVDEQAIALFNGIGGAITGRLFQLESLYPQPGIQPVSYSEIDSNDIAAFEAIDRAERQRHIWAEVFGSLRYQQDDGPTLETTLQTGGFVVGIDGQVSESMMLGLFAGVGRSEIENDLGTQQTNTETFFGGFYARYDADGPLVWDLATTAGGSRYDQDRQVANNLVVGGLETANADYDGFFISPELTVTRSYGHENPLEAFVTLRYAGLYLDGFTETGLTAGALTLEDRVIHQGAARLGIHVPRSWSVRSGTVTARATIGLEGRVQFGDDKLTGTLLGQNITFTPNDGQAVLAGFVNFEGNYTTSSGLVFYGSFESQVETEMTLALSAMAGVRMQF